MDVQRILTMRHLVAKVPLSSCYGINRPRSTMIGSNKQHIYIHNILYIKNHIYIIHDVALWFPVLIQSDCSKFCEFVGASIFQLKALERLLVLALALKSRHQNVATESAAGNSQNPETQTPSNTPSRSIEADRLKFFGGSGWTAVLHITVHRCRAWHGSTLAEQLKT